MGSGKPSREQRLRPALKKLIVSLTLGCKAVTPVWVALTRQKNKCQLLYLQLWLMKWKQIHQSHIRNILGWSCTWLEVPPWSTLTDLLQGALGSTILESTLNTLELKYKFLKRILPPLERSWGCWGKKDSYQECSFWKRNQLTWSLFARSQSYTYSQSAPCKPPISIPR